MAAPQVEAGKLDRKLKKQIGRALGAVNALPADATGDEEAVTVAVDTINQIAAADCDKAAELLIKVGLGATFNSPSAEVKIFEACKSGLSSMTDKGARKTILKWMKKRNWKVQMVLVEVVKPWAGEDEAQFALHDMVKDKKTDPRVVAEVARTLAACKDKRGVKPLIEAFGLWKKVGGVTFKAIADALYEITGKRFTEVMDWESWWDPRETTFDPQTAPKDEVGGTVERNAPKLFGSEVVSKRVVVIIDVSGSMAIKDPGEEKDEDGEVEEGEGTQERNKPGAKPKPATPPYNGPSLKPGDKDYNKLPDSRMRIERAKRQLRRLVNAFPGDTFFNIVRFSTDSAAWKPKKILPANPGNKRDSLKFIENLKANGVTAAYKALVTAFECSEADTIYFISDGSPTDDQGQPLQQAAIQQLLDKVKQLNKFRKVKVNTIGLKGSSRSFMSALADLTGGEFKQVA